MYTDKNNGYRYYSTEQFEQLNTIHYLKELGFFIKGN
ncbi:MerR family transcriptional regulator [Lysinibacillus sp. MHQ-1]|nr:MerR family transcriptional regulator [Lysinibacillus sp. MHQ-1]